MPRAYSMDLRKRVIEVCDEGQTIAQVSKRFRVSASFAETLRQRRRESGALAPKPHSVRQPRLSPENDRRLRALPDTTLAEPREKPGIKVHLSSLWHRLQRLGLRLAYRITI
jgi:transposase